MPEKSVFKTVLADRVLTDKEWIILLEIRLNELRPHLDRIALPRLDLVEFMKSDIGTPLSLVNFADEVPHTDVRGAFVASDLGDRGHVIWGLSREGEWISCVFSLFLLKSRGMSVFGISRRSFIMSSKVSPVQLHCDYRIPYRRMWDIMGDVATVCLAYRRAQLQRIEGLSRRFEIEDAFIDSFKEPEQ